MHHRLTLIHVLHIADDEATRLAQMIVLLRKAPRMDNGKIGELILEWRIARERATELDAELRTLDGTLGEGDGFRL
jgi:hypothetical protein